MSSISDKYRDQARQLQELFPSWSNDDLLSLLNDVSGDVHLAATRISDGTVEQWGEVPRKKDKKPATSAHTSRPNSSARGDARGVRGGRGRGGPGRGGAATRGRGGPPRGAANGHTSPRPSSTAPGNGVVHDQAPIPPVKPTEVESHDHQNGLIPSTSGWTEGSSQPETSSLATSVSNLGSAWGASTIAPHEVNGSVSTKQPQVVPATSNRSWAQVAKPKAVQPPSIPPPSHPAPARAPSTPPQPPIAPESEPPSEHVQNGWEEPTTVEPPTWDDDASSKPTTTVEHWPPAAEPEPEESKPEPVVAPQPEPTPEVPEAPSVPVPEPEVKQVPQAPAPAQPISVLPAQVATPSPKLTTRPASVAHRSSARHKIPDQPVTMPMSFGPGIEKIGMQFGSLNIGGDSLEPAQPKAEVAAPPTASEPSSPPAPVSQIKVQEHAVPAPPPATAPVSSNPLTSVFQQQQQQQTQIPTQATPSQPAVPHHPVPSSASQPIQQNQVSAAHAATTSPLQQFAQQTQQQQQQQQQQQASLINNQQQASSQSTHHHQPQAQHIPHLPQQIQQSHHSYSQLGLPSHLDPAQQTQVVNQQPLQSAAQANYFRQSEAASTAPYFHAPTPPASQSQDTPYASFGQLNNQGLQQGTPLGGFANSEYGYTDTARGNFYDTYAQQQGYRGPLHDDSKPIPPQQSSTGSLPTSAAQTAQQQQGSQQTQPAGGQGPQTYHGPVPYYYPHAYPQNQYYGTPYNSGYVHHPLVKYPPIFPGPPGPTSATTPTNKQPGGNVNVGVQPQTNPYNQALYQPGAYDDYSAHQHHPQHQHSHSLGLNHNTVGVSSADYGKVYGAPTQGQGFMGLGGQSGGGSGGPTSNAGPRGGASPEAAYKPYAKDVGVTPGRGGPAVQQGGQGQGNQGGPQAQSFYNANRFGAGVGGGSAGGVGGGLGGVGGPQQGNHLQQGGPQGHLGYPQGTNEPAFYGYQRQQGYWQ